MRNDYISVMYIDLAGRAQMERRGAIRHKVSGDRPIPNSNIDYIPGAIWCMRTQNVLFGFSII